MKQISSFMSEISDEFKIVVVEAIRSVNKANTKTEHFVSGHHYNILAIKCTKSNVICDNLHRPVIFLIHLLVDLYKCSLLGKCHVTSCL